MAYIRLRAKLLSLFSSFAPMNAPIHIPVVAISVNKKSTYPLNKYTIADIRQTGNITYKDVACADFVSNLYKAQSVAKQNTPPPPPKKPFTSPIALPAMTYNMIFLSFTFFYVPLKNLR